MLNLESGNFPKFLLFLVFLFPAQAFSQIYNFKNYTIENGFPPAHAIDIFQDDKGFLWVGTMGEGLVRFDGANFLKFDGSDGLVSNEVRTIAQDDKGVFWIGTEGGLCSFNGSKFSKSSDSLLNRSNIRKIFKDKKGVLWIGTFDNGLFKFNGKSFQHLTEKDGLAEKKIISIAQDKKGNLWLGTVAGGLLKYDGTSFLKYTTADGLSDNTVRAIHIDAADVVWLGTEKGLSRFENEEFRVYNSSHGIAHNLIYDISEDKVGDLWLGTLGGLVQFDGISFKNYTHKHGLTSNLVQNLYHDYEGNLWLGSDLPGITMFGVHQISYFNEKSGLSSNSVNAIVEDDNGKIWFATSRGASIFDGEEVKPVDNEIISPSESILSIQKDSTGTLWMNGTTSIISFNGSKFSKTPRKGKQGKNFFINYNRNSYNSLPPTLIKHYDTEYTASQDSLYLSRKVSVVFVDSEGTTWLGTHGEGLFSFKEDITTDLILVENEVITGEITSIVQDKEGSLWIGTDNNGVVKLMSKNGHYAVEEVFNLEDGLTHNRIMSLIFDDNNRLWVGTQNGICEINVPLFNKTKRKIVTTYGRDEGFISVHCNRNSAFKDKEGFIWFGTRGGAIKFFPATEPAYEHSFPKVFIYNVKLFYEDVNWSKYSTTVNPYFNIPEELTLSHNNNYLTFNFVGIYFSNPNKVKYQFRLIPEDEQWLPFTEKNNVTYSNLSPGKYRFEVRSSINGLWQTHPATFSFSISKPFWNTWWFFTLMSAAAFGLIYGYINIQTRNLRAIQRDLEVKVQQRTFQLEEQNSKLQDAYKIIEEKNSEITDSIRYAKNIQEAILPPMHLLKNFLPDSFVFFMPKDIVSGDFYWLAQTETKVIVAAVDCTGHGVPGAFMSFVGFNLLNQIVNQSKITRPSDILNNLNISLNESLKNTLGRADIRDGMDIAICTIDVEEKTAEFAGAYNPLYHLRDKKLTIYPADRFPVGSYMETNQRKFTNHTIQLCPGDTVYIFTDGYSDQFGGPDDKKFMYSRFRNLLMNIQDLNMTEQKLVLYKEFQNWKGVNEQVDDILVIGIRV